LATKVFVAGVGSPYRHDDGVGIEVIKQFQAHEQHWGVFYYAGTDSLALMEQLRYYQHAIVVDAALMGEPPGTVKIFSPEEAKLKINSDALSTHGLGLGAMLNLSAGLAIPTKIKIIGIEPENVEFGAGLSAVVKKQIPKVLMMIRELANNYLGGAIC
jgi:hydrogenase maturation protease